MNKNTTKDIVYMAIFIAIMTVFTLFVSIPFYPVPLTFQTVICILCGLLLGAQRGGLAMAIYVVMGIIGLPVFSGARGGPAMVLSPTFGYIISFPLCAIVAGLVRGKSEKVSLKRYVLASLAAFLACYAVGIPYFLLIWKFYLGKAGLLTAMVTMNVIYMPKDLVLCILAAVVAWKTSPMLFRQQS